MHALASQATRYSAPSDSLVEASQSTCRLVWASTASTASAAIVFRAARENPDECVKGINKLFMDVDYMVYQLKYDSVHKR